jgi:hypothetical protein
MSISFHYSDDMVRVINLEEGSLVDNLKPAIYYVKYNQMMGFYLEKGNDSFAVPKRLFGTVKRRVEKVKTTFDSRSAGTGILLTGDKGAGKTMLAEVLCNNMINSGMPIVIINDRYTGSNFTSFIDDLGSVVLLFDEFGKLYPTKQRDTDENNTSQESLLSLLDGVNRQKRMVIMTENSENDINTFIKARPGRVFYHFKYKKLDEETIKEFAQWEKIPNNIVDLILDASRKMYEFSFDTLKAIVEEYQRFGCTSDEEFEELLTDINIEYDKDKKIRLKVINLIEKATDKKIEVDFMSAFLDKPKNEHEYFYVNFENKNKNKNRDNDAPVAVSESDEEANEYVCFHGHNIKYTSNEKVIFEDDNYLMVTEVQEDYKSSYNYSAF